MTNERYLATKNNRLGHELSIARAASPSAKINTSVTAETSSDPATT
ncbi:MAG: hypothetical protein ACR2H3_05730 [Acidimicrobiales bacterium]